jgi:hypothetical protein
LVLGCTGGEGGGVTPPATVASVRISPDTATVLPGQTRQLQATVRNEAGGVLTGRPVVWASDDTTMATVDQAGLVRARAEGPVRISATSGGQSGEAIIRVAPAPVAFVTLRPDTAIIQEGHVRHFTVLLHDADRKVLHHRDVEWRSSDTRVAYVDAYGAVSGVGAGHATISAQSEGITGTATVTVVSPFTDVSGAIQANTTWSRARSPYRLTGTVQVGPGVTLTIEPGVTVTGIGTMRYLDVLGTVRAVGTPQAPVELEWIFARTDAAGVLHVEHAYVREGGYGPLQDRSGAFILRNSLVSDSDPFNVRDPRGDVYIERNFFQNAGGIRAGANQGRVYVRNNYFGRGRTTGGGRAALEILYGSTAHHIVQHNTFAATSHIAVMLTPDAPDLLAAENYWGSTDETDIQAMIDDVHDNPAAKGTVEYRPFLTAPHPLTPAP